MRVVCAGHRSPSVYREQCTRHRSIARRSAPVSARRQIAASDAKSTNSVVVVRASLVNTPRRSSPVCSSSLLRTRASTDHTCEISVLSRDHHITVCACAVMMPVQGEAQEMPSFERRAAPTACSKMKAFQNSEIVCEWAHSLSVFSCQRSYFHAVDEEERMNEPGTTNHRDDASLLTHRARELRPFFSSLSFTMLKRPLLRDLSFVASQRTRSIRQAIRYDSNKAKAINRIALV